MKKELLTSCGLNNTEQTVLLFLLEFGRNTVSIISKRTGIKRPTVYSALASLEGMGLTGRHVTSNTTYFSSIEPDAIPSVFVSRAKTKFESTTHAALRLESQLKQYKRKDRHKIAGYEISTLESTDAVYAFLEQTLEKGNYRGIFNPQTAFQGRGKEIGRNCLEATEQNKAKIKEIAIKGPLCKWWKKSIKNPNHVVKEISLSQALLTDILLFENTVMLTNYNPNSEMSILIKHEEYYKFMVGIFDVFWKMLPD